MPAADILEISLMPIDSERLFCLCGQYNKNLRLLETRLGVRIHQRGHAFKLVGDKAMVEKTARLLQQLYLHTENNHYLEPQDIHINLQENAMANLHPKQTTTKESEPRDVEQPIVIKTPRMHVEPRGANQKQYVIDLRTNVVQFAIGPAGTGKTFLAVACALEQLRQKQIEHICLVRPAVEAGENLGYLPGTLIQKINPYLRPLYDALTVMMGQEELNDHMVKNIIEVGALAYMRGRTLDNCFAILDEGQNCSREQVKMFLTRLGFNSKAVITGDLTQIDLQPKTSSGLAPTIELLGKLDEIGISRLNSGDVVRHPIVTKIIRAYTTADAKKRNPNGKH